LPMYKGLFRDHSATLVDVTPAEMRIAEEF
jgi:hypothetical protein